MKFGKSQSAGRVEDRRFLTGQGRYIADAVPVGALHGVFLRSPFAHARLDRMDVAAARALPGVRLVLTAADLRAAGLDMHVPAVLLTNADGTGAAAPQRPLMAETVVRFVGEAMAFVVADTIDAARDGIEAITFEVAQLDAKTDLAPGGPVVHPEAPDNVAYDWRAGDAAAADAAFARAAHVVRVAVPQGRVMANPIEPRGAVAVWDGDDLHLAFSGQGVWGMRDDLVRALHLDPARVRVTTPDVGGGFGMKVTSYPEPVVLAHAARVAGAAVQWMPDRNDAMQSDNGGRDLVTEAAMAFDRDLKMIGYRIEILSNLGAYNSQIGQLIQSELASRVVTGGYDIGAMSMRARGIFTHTTQVDAYRGAGQPEIITVLEQLVDQAARELGVDVWDLRARNFIRRFPFATLIGETYDVGDFDRVAARVRDLGDLAGFAARRAASAACGKLRGIGSSFYVMAVLGEADEHAEIALEEDGFLTLYVGTQSNGQGHETVHARVLSALTGVAEDHVRVVQGDSARIAHGNGTGGSRSASVQSAATYGTVGAMIAALTPFVADLAGLPPDDVRFADGAFRAPGSNLAMTLTEAGDRARAVGRHDLLHHRRQTVLPGPTYPNGAHLAEVEVDPDTGETTLVAYTAISDFGTLIDEDIVAGQVHGGVAQGVGQAMMELAVHDREGQLLTASFLDYAMPRATDLPAMRLGNEPVPSPLHPLGIKGCGEAGTIGAVPAVANAVADALWPLGVRRVDMPFSPLRVWTAIGGATRHAEAAR